jgi:predicted ATPase
MKAVAPAWYSRAAPGGTGESAHAPSQPAMLREFSDFVQEVSRLGAIVLFIDDVQWADHSTVDLLAHVGRQCAALRVLVIVTYRPTDLLRNPHPFHDLRHELQGKGACSELSLGFLSPLDIGRYLRLAFPAHNFPPDFAELIHARTEGNPLFMVESLRYLRERGVIAPSAGGWQLAPELPDLRHEMPESVRGIIRRKLDRLDEADRRLLAAAAVQGPEFDSAVVAGALNLDAAEVEERLQALDRLHGLVRLERASEFPDRTLTLRCAFVHVFYQQALDADLSPTRRAALAAALAHALESHHRADSAEAASQLEYLYEVGRDFGRAARQCWLAAQNAAQVFAHREAIELARRGLRLLSTMPDTRDRSALELPLQTMLGLQLQVTQGYAAAEATQAYRRARALYQAGPNAPPLFPVLWGLWLAAKARSELTSARELAGELQALAARQGDPDLALQAQQALAVTTLCLGDPAATLAHVDQATALYDPTRHRAQSYQFGQDPGVACKAFGAVALWLRGQPEAGIRMSAAALTQSHQLAQPSTQALALHFAAMVHQLRRDPHKSLACAEACATFATLHGLSFWKAGSGVMAGWALATSTASEEGLGRLRRGLIDWDATGSVTYKTYYLGLLAEVLMAAGHFEECGRVLDQSLALVQSTAEGLYEPELHRLRGELLLRSSAEPGPETLERARGEFATALDLARRQGAKSLELRAALSLTLHAARLGADEHARRQLADCYNSFTEGLDTPDVRAARDLLGA